MSEKSENRPEALPAGNHPEEGRASGVTADDDAETPRRDGLRAVLAGRGRRYVLRCLGPAETPMALADLTDELVRRVADAPPTEVQDERERIYALLYHYYLPKLADAGPVSFDPDRKLVDLREDEAVRASDDVRASGSDRPGDSL